MFEMTVPLNSRVPVPHYHKDVDEVMYGLEGTLTMTVDNEKHEIGPGDSLFVGRGRIHHFNNTSPSTARVLVVLNPGSIGRKYFEEIAQEINVPGKPDLANVEKIMLRHGLVPA
jgi:mannose-6-phosphate isomerase-like protein (cupin superfamily)